MTKPRISRRSRNFALTPRTRVGRRMPCLGRWVGVRVIIPLPGHLCPLQTYGVRLRNIRHPRFQPRHSLTRYRPSIPRLPHPVPPKNRRERLPYPRNNRKTHQSNPGHPVLINSVHSNRAIITQQFLRKKLDGVHQSTLLLMTLWIRPMLGVSRLRRRDAIRRRSRWTNGRPPGG